MKIIKQFNLFMLLVVFSSVGYADNPGDVEDVTSENEEVVALQEEVAESSDESADESSSESDADEEVATSKSCCNSSRLKRTDLSGALPLLVITKEDIEASGFRLLKHFKHYQS